MRRPRRKVKPQDSYELTRADRKVKLVKLAKAKKIITQVLQEEQDGLLLGSTRRTVRIHSLGPKTRELLVQANNALARALMT